MRRAGRSIRSRTATARTQLRLVASTRAGQPMLSSGLAPAKAFQVSFHARSFRSPHTTTCATSRDPRFERLIMSESPNAAECSHAIRAAIKARYPGVQIVLDGVIVVEAIEDDEPDPVVRTIGIGDIAPWRSLGLFHVGIVEATNALNAGWEEGDE